MIDNALDAADNAGIAPVLSIELSGDFFTVADNGPGLPLAMLEGVGITGTSTQRLNLAMLIISALPLTFLLTLNRQRKKPMPEPAALTH